MASPGRSRTRPDPRSGLARPLVVRDQLEEASVGVAEVHTHPVAASAAAGHGPDLDLDALAGEVSKGALRAALPTKAEVGAAWLDREPGEWLGARAGTVDVQLDLPEPIGPAPSVQLDQLDTEDVTVEGVRALPVADGDDHVVQRDG